LHSSQEGRVHTFGVTNGQNWPSNVNSVNSTDPNLGWPTIIGHTNWRAQTTSVKSALLQAFSHHQTRF
jgi:hypothetical protein